MRMQQRLMKKSSLPRKKTVLRTLERVAFRQRKKVLQISMTLFTPRQQLRVAAPQRKTKLFGRTVKEKIHLSQREV